MNIHKHLTVTYDNNKCHIGNCGFIGNLCVVIQMQVKEKDNRPVSKHAVIF